jgi:hypothetical protein
MSRLEIIKDYYPNGVLYQEGGFINGIPHGLHREWHPNGVLAYELNYKNGIPDGIGRGWDEYGKPLFQFEIKDGTGVQITWLKEQDIFLETTWIDGTFTGRQRIYHKDGKTTSELYWIRGKKVSKKHYFKECQKDTTLPRYNDNMTISEKELIPSKEPRTSPPDSSNDEFCGNIISSGKAIEARQWLKGRKCYLGEDMDDKETSKLLDSLYKAGAVNVWVFDITEDEPEVEYSGRIIIEMPKDGNKRSKLIKLSNKITAGDGFEEEVDYGQKYIFLMLD